MSIVTLDQAIAHCRLDSDYPPDQLQPYIDGAESAAAGYLNRAIFVDQSTLDAAVDAVPAALATAGEAYAAALAAAAAITDADQKSVALDIARMRIAAARKSANTTIHGMVANASIIAAILLTLGNLFANREAVVIGATAVELPLGACAMLRHDRRVMMP